MTTYWLLGEKEEAEPPPVMSSIQDDQTVARHEVKVASTAPACIPEDENPHLPSETGSVTSEISRKAHFIENVSETGAENRDFNNRSSKTNNPSNSRLSDSPSSQTSQPSTHIFSNPMTSIVIINDEDTGQPQPQLGMPSSSFQQPTSSLR